jgi:hypothetical protein
VVAPAVWFEQRAFGPQDQRNLSIAAAAAVYVRTHTRPGQRILVWGQAPEVYWESERLSATRFATTGFVTGSTGNRPANDIGEGKAVPGAWSEFLADLHAHPPVLIVDMSQANQRGAANYPPKRFRQFMTYLRDGDWTQITRVAGTGIYARRGAGT